MTASLQGEWPWGCGEELLLPPSAAWVYIGLVLTAGRKRSLRANSLTLISNIGGT
jgi:hypothetical protein